MSGGGADDAGGGGQAGHLLRGEHRRGGGRRQRGDGDVQWGGAVSGRPHRGVPGACHGRTPLDAAVAGDGDGGDEQQRCGDDDEQQCVAGGGELRDAGRAAGARLHEPGDHESERSILEDRVVSAAGSYSATAALCVGSWIMQLVAFRAAGGGGVTRRRRRCRVGWGRRRCRASADQPELDGVDGQRRR